jgi:triacylglycerol lipase
MFASLSPPQRRLVFGLAGLAVIGIALGVSVAFVAGGTDRIAPADQSRPGPVVLIPGYGGSETALNELADRLRAEGHTTSVVALPDGGIGDLRTQAKAVGSAVDALLRTSGSPSVDVIGYSAGGVVARLWIRDYGGAAKARRVITLGAPQHGTDVAQLAGSLIGCPTACEQLRPTSDLLATLNAGDQTPAGPLWVSIWSSTDTVVEPADSSRLSGAINLPLQGVCPSAMIAHGNLPTDLLVQSIVAAELIGPTTTAFTSADCARLSS